MTDDIRHELRDSNRTVTISEQRLDYSGFRRIETITYREEESGVEARRELVRTQRAVAVLVRDPVLDRLVMIRQYRMGAELAQGAGECVEVVAGIIDEGESPAETARRETLEETGLSVRHLAEMCRFMTSPGIVDEQLILFYAEADASQLPDRAGVDHETEETAPFTCSLEEALAAVDAHAIGNGIAMIALFWFARHRAVLTGEVA